MQQGKLNQSNINHFFDTVTNSEMVGVKKPNPKIFKHALQMAKATAKGGAKLVSFDMNEGLVGSIGKKEADASELDEDIEVLKARKNQAVKADNVNNMFLENIGAITDSVNTFA